GLDDVLVVHDLLAHVDRRTVLLQGLLDGDDCAVHTSAVATGGGEQDPAGCLSGHAPIVRARPAGAGSARGAGRRGGPPARDAVGAGPRGGGRSTWAAHAAAAP